jgi:tetratricopeptide (TPR) repeat protein
MKPKRLAAGLFLALAVFFTAVPAGALSLDEGIDRIARDIEAGLPGGTRVAVVNFASPSAYFSDYVLEELQAVLVNNRKLVVTERSQLELLRDELTFQMSGEVSAESRVIQSRFLGAQVLIEGSMTDLGGSYRCRFNAIDVATEARKASSAVTVERDDTIAFMLSGTQDAPNLAVVYFNTGFAHYEAKQYALAVADFTRALEIKKNDITTLCYRGHAYRNLLHYDRAIADYTQVLRLNPNDTNA